MGHGGTGRAIHSPSLCSQAVALWASSRVVGATSMSLAFTWGPYDSEKLLAASPAWLRILVSFAFISFPTSSLLKLSVCGVLALYFSWLHAVNWSLQCVCLCHEFRQIKTSTHAHGIRVNNGCLRCHLHFCITFVSTNKDLDSCSWYHYRLKPRTGSDTLVMSR
jgi:hypothetical protein